MLGELRPECYYLPRSVLWPDHVDESALAEWYLQWHEKETWYIQSRP